MFRSLVIIATACALAGCGPQYSPDTYSSAAVQQANKVDRGTVIGVRRVDVSAQGVVGAASGAAVGGVAGSQSPGGTVGSAFGAVGGALLGGLVGTGVEHATADTFAFEYIVRKPAGDLISVTQKDTKPLAVGTKVLVIAGAQARIVPDYTVASGTPPPEPAAPPAQPTETVPPPAPVKETPLLPPSAVTPAVIPPTVSTLP